jgi:tetratricopeptide (TPR) repeat protein
MDAAVSAQFNQCIKSLNNGDISSAYDHLQKARTRLLDTPENDIQWAIYYLNLSAVYNNSGRFQDSIESCKRAKEVLKKKRNRQVEAKVSDNMASACLNLSDYARAQKNIEKAISLYQKEKQNEALAGALLVLGEILLRKGDWPGAIQKCSRALLLARQSGSKRTAGKALVRLGYIFRGDPDIFEEGGYRYLAIDHFRQAERYFREAAYKPGLAEALYERANTCISFNMAEKAWELIKRMETITPSGSPMRFFLLNLTYCLNNREGQFEDAVTDAGKLRRFHEQAGDKKGVADSLEKLGSAYYNLGDMERAKKCGEDALNLASQIGDELIRTKSRQLLMDIDKVADPFCN